MPTAPGTAAAGATAAAASRRLQIAATAMVLLSALTPSGRSSVCASLAPSADKDEGVAEAAEGSADEDWQENEEGGGGEDKGGGNGDSGDVGGPEVTEVTGAGSDEAASIAVETADEADGEGRITERREEEDQGKEDKEEKEEEDEEKRPVAEDKGNTAAEEDAAAAAAKDEVTERAEASPAPEPKQQQQEQGQRRRFKRARRAKQAPSSRRTGGGATREGGGTGGLLETDAGNASTIADGRSSPGVGGIGGGAAAEGAVSELRSTDVRGGLEVQEHDGVEAGEQRELCRATGPCVWCEKEDLHLDYCKETGRRQEVRCSAVAAESGEGDQSVAGVGAGAIGMLPSSVRYRSCTYAEEDDFQGLLHFSMVMAVLGVVACFGMRRRQEKTGSLYDRRAK